MEIEELWSERIEPPYDIPVACELTRVEDGDCSKYQFSITEGPFSGYPTIDLDRGALERLRDVLDKELYRSRTCPNCSTPINEVYGKCCITCGTFIA